MKKTLYTYFAKLSAILALLSIWSCSDDFSSPEPVNDGDMATLSLIIPHPHMNASRADNSSLGNIGSLESDEGKINSLWILAYAADENSDDIITRLTPDGDKLTEDYSSYMVKIPAGKYNVYTVANVDGIDKNTTEDRLKSLVLAYSEETIPNPAKGLPMVCTEEMNIEIAPAETKELFIDLTFLCVKLRYTILFDNSEDGFSKNAFGDNPIKITGVHAENISDRNALLSYDVPTDAGSFNLDMIPGYHCQYPADINRFLDLNWNTVKDSDPSANNLAAIEESELNPNKRAYQGIVYLPENRNTEKPTTLIFDAVADNGNSFQYTVELPPVSDNAVFPDKDSDNKYVDDPHKDRMLQRGHFYDIIGRITTIGNRFDIIAGIAPWTLQNVAYSLHGPYFLHVEKTAIQVTAGVESQIAYDTDAEPLTFDSPEYNGKKLFNIKTVENAGVKYISVNINPDVQAASGVNFNSYFYINAANLKKRIEVTPVSLEPYFNIDPQDIEINVGEYISSGIYGETIDINFSTNLHNVTISKPSELDSDLTVINLEGPTVYDVSTEQQT